MKLEERRARRKAAMPEVEKLVRRFGIEAVSGCLHKIRERGKLRKKVEKMRGELAALQRRI